MTDTKDPPQWCVDAAIESWPIDHAMAPDRTKRVAQYIAKHADQRIAELERQRDGLLAALSPFAREGCLLDPSIPSGERIRERDYPSFCPPIADDYRQAAAAIEACEKGPTE